MRTRILLLSRIEGLERANLIIPNIAKTLQMISGDDMAQLQVLIRIDLNR